MALKVSPTSRRTVVQEAQAGYDRAVASEIAAENNIDNTREVLREIIGVYLTDYSKLGENMPLLSPDPADIDSRSGWKAAMSPFHT